MFVGVDDGYADTKIVVRRRNPIRIPSMARAGARTGVTFGGPGAAGGIGNGFYDTSEGTFEVGALLDNANSTMSPGYPTSAMEPGNCCPCLAGGGNYPRTSRFTSAPDCR